MPCGAFNFNFYKKNFTNSQNYLSFPRVIHFSNKFSSTVYTKSVLDLVGQFFLKWCWGTCLNGRQKNFRGGWGGNLPWMMLDDGCGSWDMDEMFSASQIARFLIQIYFWNKMIKKPDFLHGDIYSWKLKVEWKI